MASMEEKLLLLEKRFNELEGKYLTLQVDMLKDKNTDPKGLKTEVKTEGVKKEDEKASKPEDSSTSKARVRIVTSRIDTTSKERKDFDSEIILDSTTTRDYALLLRKNLEEENEENDGDIEIYDDDLLKLLQKLLRHYPGHLFEGKPATLTSPYEPLVQNWDFLMAESIREDQEDSRARSDLRELLETIAKGSGDAKLDSYLQVRDSFKSQHSINFEALWTIFPPGTVVYGHLFLKRHQIFIVEDNLETWPRLDNSSRSRSPNNWFLRCWTYDYTGTHFLRKAVKLPFEQSQGTKPISSLPFYPMNEMSAEKRTDIEAELLKSGNLFRQYCTAKEGDRMYKYKGQAIFDKKGLRDLKSKDSSSDSNNLSSLGALLLGRDRPGLVLPKPSLPSYQLNNVDVMVDFGSYYLHGSPTSQIGDTVVEEEITACQCPACSKNEVLAERFKPHYDGKKGGKYEEWEPLQTMLCPPRVLGYILQDKQWAQLDVDSLDTVPDEDVRTVMNSLHLGGEDDGQREKDLLYWLVKNHGTGKAKKNNKGYELDDIVAEKGKGLVILLYGTPGVGKTSTAQMIAKAAKKPLFPISVADVGTDAEYVESNFRRIFDLATTWKAILLIDEADVFLQSRTQGPYAPSAERSALVSVFLRVLEYYRGILFLTTNQIAQFDIAVQSRVHIALKYEDLSKKQTKDIFMSFLSQYEEMGMVQEYGALEKYAGKELHGKGFDGRQLRNIISCAMGHARGSNEKLSLEHVTDIIYYVEAFKKDLAGQMMKWKEMQNRTQLG